MKKCSALVVVMVASIGCSKQDDKAKTDPNPGSAAAKPMGTEPTPTPTPGSAAATPGSADPAATPDAAAAAAGGAKCADGQFGGGDIPFCIKLPDGYAADPVGETGDAKVIEVKADGGFKKFYLMWEEVLWDKYPEALPSRLKALDEDAAKGKPMGKGDLADGKGKFVLFSATPKEKNQNIWFKSVFKGSKYAIECKGAWFTDKPTPEIGDACKTLVPR